LIGTVSFSCNKYAALLLAVSRRKRKQDNASDNLVFSRSKKKRVKMLIIAQVFVKNNTVSFFEMS
jgi:hypothetical protein